MTKLSAAVTGFALAIASIPAISADALQPRSANSAPQAEPSKGAREGQHEGIKQELTEWEKEMKQRARAIRRELHQKLSEAEKEMKSKSAQIRQEAKEKLAALKKEMHEKRATGKKGEKRKND